jgi:CheY-like chemotaxis protein
MPAQHRVALQGFTAFERSALASCFRLPRGALPAYQTVDELAQADFVIADADHAGVIDAVLGAGRMGDTIFVGSTAPEGAAAWTMRPIDPLYVLRELDAMVALRNPSAVPAAAPSRRAAPRDAPGRRAADAATPEHRPAAPVRGEVLIVDDSEVALRLLERELPLLGLRTERALDSAQAISQLASRHFDAVILDVELGEGSELDGLALCQRLKRAPGERGRPAPPIVMLTAHDAPVNRVRGTLAGCDAWLAKPLDIAELARTLRGLGVPLSDATPPAAPQP